MCRLLAMPPNTSQEEAHDLLRGLEQHNTDGVGSAYVSGTQFVVTKYPMAYSEAKTKGLKIFSHMPHHGWTIAHVRAASVGSVTIVNTHPFVKGNLCVVHNGSFNNHGLVKNALRGFAKFSGETDSEVAAFLMHRLGPAYFYQTITGDGAFLALNRDGSLFVVNTGGDIELANKDGKVYIASRLWGMKNTDYHRRIFIKFDKHGKKLISDEEKVSGYNSSRYDRNSISEDTGRTLKQTTIPMSNEHESYKKRYHKVGGGYLWTDYD